MEVQVAAAPQNGGLLQVLLPLHESAALAGLVLVGLGCAPIYPCIIHSTPGQQKKAAMTSLAPGMRRIWLRVRGRASCSSPPPARCSVIISMGTVVSSLQSDRLTKRLGAGRVTAASVGLTAAALFGAAAPQNGGLLQGAVAEEGGHDLFGPGDAEDLAQAAAT